jgi:hypothetical protein
MYDIENFYQRTIALLASQFQTSGVGSDQTNFQKFLAAMVTECTQINAAELQLANDRYLATAIGVQLDGIGQILGLARLPDQTDAEYREALYFQVFINKSTATPEEAIATLKFLTKASHIGYFELPSAFYEMSTDGLPENFSIPPDAIVNAISAISPAGVNYVPITCTFGISPIFIFCSDPIIEDFYVSPDPSDLTFEEAFHVSPDGIGDDQFLINRGQTLSNPSGGWFAEDGYTVANAGYFAEVLVINGAIPPPY